MIEPRIHADEHRSESITSIRVDSRESAAGNYRWVICALLFFAATINYIDRQVIGILKPTLQTEIGWTEVGYSWVVFSFQAAYAIGLLGVGRLMDRIGT
ncbi:MAG TPA: MFS transporter, partial [Pyrinomonadaceae bacterium]